MLYYKVKPEMNGKTRWREDISHKVIADGEFIEGELFTVRELSYYRLSVYAFEHGFEKVNISKKKIYWSFGARFAMAEAENDPSCDVELGDWYYEEAED